MLLTKGQKLKKYFSAFVVGVVFLFVLSAQNALATSTITTYQKPVNGTLESAEWNGLLTDFVNTWLPATMVGPLGIGTSSQVGKLNVEGAGTYSAIFTNGSVGIGLTNPSQMLHVNGAGQFDQFVYGITPVNVPAYKMALATVEYVNSALATSTQNILDAGFWKLSGDNLFASSTSWRLGIGTTNPTAKIEIIDTTGTTGTLKTNVPWNVNIIDQSLTRGGLITGSTESGMDIIIGIHNSKGLIQGRQRSPQATRDVLINPFGGNVGIGTNNPIFRLAVSGPIVSGFAQASPIANGVYAFGTDQPGNNLYAGMIGGTPGVDGNTSYVKFGSYLNNGLGEMSYIALTRGGNVGIGTTNPMLKLQVNGDMAFGTSNNATINQGMTGNQNYFTFSTNGVEKMRITTAGNVGIGTTTPAQLLHVAGQAQFDNLAFGVTPVNSLANKLALATVEYVNGYVSTATSTLASTTIGKFVGATPDTYNGSNNGHPGYAYANNQCATTPSMLGSHVCTTAEILNTILLANNTLPSEDVWIFSGPPGFTAMANDCIARTSVNNDANTFGAIWQGKTVQYPEGRGLLKHCHETAKIACCK